MMISWELVTPGAPSFIFTPDYQPGAEGVPGKNVSRQKHLSGFNNFSRPFTEKKKVQPH